MRSHMDHKFTTIHPNVSGRSNWTLLWKRRQQRLTKCSSHRIVFQFSLMQVDDVGAHTIQEVLWVWDEHKDSLEPVDNEQDEQHIQTVGADISDEEGGELTTWAPPPTTHKHPDPSGSLAHQATAWRAWWKGLWTNWDSGYNYIYILHVNNSTDTLCFWVNRWH